MIQHYYFYMSSLPILSHTIAKSNTFLITSPFDVTKLQKKKNCLDVSSTGSFPSPMPMVTHIHIPYHSYGDGVDLNNIERVIINLIVPENYSFDTIISDHFYRPLMIWVIMNSLLVPVPEKNKKNYCVGD